MAYRLIKTISRSRSQIFFGFNNLSTNLSSLFQIYHHHHNQITNYYYLRSFSSSCTLFDATTSTTNSAFSTLDSTITDSSQSASNIIDEILLLNNNHEHNLDSNVYHSLISGEEIRQRQHNLLHLTTDWLRVHNHHYHHYHQNYHKSPLILIASNPPQFQAHTTIPVAYGKQNTDFTYLTGLHSAGSDQLTSDCVLALYAENPDIDPDVYQQQLRSVIFAPTRTKSEQLWNGADLADSLYSKSGFLSEITTDGVKPLSELIEFINTLIKQSSRRDIFLSKHGLQYRPELVTQLKYYMIHGMKMNNNYNNKINDW